VDEMLGRLARYFRILGCDTEYLRGVTDEEVLERQRGTDRILLTRDVDLARRSVRAQLLHDVEIRGQLRELWTRWPELPRTPRFDRCTACNGRLLPLDAGAGPGSADRPLTFRCPECDHRYWSGSHTARLERDLALWSEGLDS
jgi:uncharacterized protein